MMNLKELIPFLSIKNIEETNIPTDYLNNCEETFGEKDNFIVISINENEHFSVEFNTFISWKNVNSGGDGYNDENYDSFEDIEVEIELINIVDYDNDNTIDLDDVNSINELEKYIIDLIEENK
tara:strand:+ start:107250 stop:107618 length:369 start_codon:yes stop_codon:yes gene_type:complete